MKRIIFILSVITLLTACQKEDKNGDLGGFWKLKQIEEIATDSIIDLRDKDNFWSIQLKLLTTTGGGKGRFQHVGDSLYIQMIYSPENPKEFGFYNPKDERFGVKHLDRNGMILQSKEAILTFKKF
ncbi:MAG: hypothetical protein E7088_08845 [Bacteroidales bacterium]|nr:hypothetical protein [Bacteroidales bacterium]